MKVPNFNKAVVPQTKIEGYILSASHPIGRTKAAYFKELGFSIDNSEKLINELVKIITNNDYEEIVENDFGIKYIINGKVTKPDLTTAENNYRLVY